MLGIRSTDTPASIKQSELIAAMQDDRVYH